MERGLPTCAFERVPLFKLWRFFLALFQLIVDEHNLSTPYILIGIAAVTLKCGE